MDDHYLSALYSYYATNATIAQAIVGGLVFIVTAVYVVLTRGMLEEMRRVRQPQVYIEIRRRPRSHCGAYIVVGNRGQTAARNVQFQLLRDFAFRVGDPELKCLANLAWLADGFPLLAPGIEHSYLLIADGSDCAADDLKAVLTVTYENAETGKPHKPSMVVLDATVQARQVYHPALLDASKTDCAGCCHLSERNDGKAKALARRRDKRQCPFCAEWVYREASVCRYCQHSLSPSEDAS